MYEKPIEQYRTTDNRLVRIFPDDYAPDPAKDQYLTEECKREMREMWLAGEVYVAEVFPANISLLDYEAGNDVEYMGGFYGLDSVRDYFPEASNEKGA